MMGLRPRQENLRLFSDYLSLMLGKSRITLNNLKTSLRFPCLGLNPIVDCISVTSPYEDADSRGANAPPFGIHYFKFMQFSLETEFTPLNLAPKIKIF